jgi:hypothetical protein
MMMPAPRSCEMRKAAAKFLLKKLTLLTQDWRQNALGCFGRRSLSFGGPSQES